MATSTEDSESVDQFLARIASLKDRRDREDEERTRKLEEEILQGRRERQARRAERARSLSPSKDSMNRSNSSITDSKPASSRAIDPPVDFSPQPQYSTPTKSSSTRARREEAPTNMSPLEADSRSMPPPQSSQDRSSPVTSTSLARSGTLSWQQRPSSRDSNSSRPRPLSGTALFARSPKTEQNDTRSSQELSRSQIAESLGGKDPSWFRQTSDRGIGSAAYRKRQVEDEPEEKSFATGPSRQLPGMSQWTAEEPEEASMSRNVRPEQREPVPDYQISQSPFTDTSPAPSRSSHIEAREEGRGLEVTPVLSAPRPAPINGFSQDRAPSPTKGLGGFVQSAMMKRSDSVNKRWNVQANAGLKRGDSVAGNRSTLASAGSGGFASGASRSPTRASRIIGSEPPSSPLSSSRPTSSHITGLSSVELSNTARGNSIPADEPTKSLQVSDEKATESNKTIPDHELPASPTKTSDPRRWSPTKASWLESALTRPESPKITPLKPDQPAWKVDLQRSRSTRPSTEEVANIMPKHEVVSHSALLKSPPLGGHTRPLSISGMPEGFSTGMVRKGDASPPRQIVEPATKQVFKQNTTETPKVRAEKPLTASSRPLDKEPTQPTKSFSTNASIESEIPKSPPAIKPKPQTPPKTDFRANLKSRQPTSQQNDAEPEFKAVFGKLKRTETRNYVAPDELKGNITRGKAALNNTGGPQKSKRVDDFKESILQKKEEMKIATPASQTKSVLNAPAKPDKPAVLPEALARRQTLKQSSSSTVLEVAPARSIKQAEVASKPEPISLQRSLPEAKAPRKAATDGPPPSEPAANTSLPALEKSGSLPEATASSSVGTSKLAARLNPSLAGFLSRSSSPKINSSDDSHLDSTTQTIHARSTQTSSEANEDSSLTHMTKGRARGPKRRLPKSEASSEPKDASKVRSQELNETSQASRTLEKESTSESEKRMGNRFKVDLSSRQLLDSSEAASLPSRKQNPQNESKAPEPAATSEPVEAKSKPAVATKSPELRKVASPPDSKASMRGGFSIPSDGNESASTSTVKSPKRPDVPAKSPLPKPSPLTPSTTKINTSRTAQEAHNTASPKPLGARPSPNSKGLALNFDRPLVPRFAVVPSDPTPPLEQTKLKTASSPVKSGHATDTLSAFFDQPPQSRDNAEFDTQAIMQPSTPDNKLKNLNVQIWEITGDGKRQLMPPQQEHILFEESMYLCVHGFQDSKGTKTTNAYLWHGDAVSESAVEDAQLFCKKTAREHGAKLDVVSQGKEPAAFFQAVGGILITRRTKSSALYMLCGRRHLGHVAFDEVDFELDSLCSGFPYIISAKFGKLFLWKGKGSGADELGCARLIGMDLGLTGEIEEVEEDREPLSFFEALSTTPRDRRGHGAEDEVWELKPDQDKYACRLYRIEHDRPRSAGGFWGGLRASSPPKSANRALIQEIEPFRQADLDPGHVFVLDCFFKIYIFTGPLARSKAPEFVTACHLAQDMSILAPSLQDRPLMPVASVVLGGDGDCPLPPEFTGAFRKWRGRKGAGAVVGLEEVFKALE